MIDFLPISVFVVVKHGIDHIWWQCLKSMRREIYGKILVKMCSKYCNFVQKLKFCQIWKFSSNLEIFVKFGNFRQIWKFSSNVEILVKTVNYSQKSKFWSKIEILIKRFTNFWPKFLTILFRYNCGYNRYIAVYNLNLCLKVLEFVWNSQLRETVGIAVPKSFSFFTISLSVLFIKQFYKNSFFISYFIPQCVTTHTYLWVRTCEFKCVSKLPTF